MRVWVYFTCESDGSCRGQWGVTVVHCLQTWLSSIPSLPVHTCPSSIKRSSPLPHPLILGWPWDLFWPKEYDRSVPGPVLGLAFSRSGLMPSYKPATTSEWGNLRRHVVRKPKVALWRKRPRGGARRNLRSPAASWMHLSDPAIVLWNKSTIQPSLNLLPDPQIYENNILVF